LWIIGLLCTVIVVPVLWILITRLEGETPAMTLSPDIRSIGISQNLTVSASDDKSGLRRLWIGLLQKGKEIQLLEKEFPAAGVFNGGQVHNTSVEVALEPRELGLVEGEAVIRMVASDFSWRRWWRGNRTYSERRIVIDTRAPEIEVLTRVHNVSQGGSALVVYKVSEPCSETGVSVGDKFFPGYSGYFKDANLFLAFFALGHEQGPGTRLAVQATDIAGNITRAGFPHYIRKKAFKADTIRISDKFLEWKMPEFGSDLPKELDSASFLDKFLYVNRDIRQANYETITRIPGQCHSNGTMYWEGAFLRLQGAARKASFADQRRYVYQGRDIDRQTHLGVDLASVSLAPVPAANSGKIVFIGAIGIYGRTVIVDHGFGLSSTYSHLSSCDVKTGQMVLKGDIIGHTGTTGMAGGDHLHFGMMVHNTFVNPVEWWDLSWIRNNITDKIKTVQSGLNISNG